MQHFRHVRLEMNLSEVVQMYEYWNAYKREYLNFNTSPNEKAKFKREHIVVDGRIKLCCAMCVALRRKNVSMMVWNVRANI